MPKASENGVCRPVAGPPMMRVGAVSPFALAGNTRTSCGALLATKISLSRTAMSRGKLNPVVLPPSVRTGALSPSALRGQTRIRES